MSSPSRLDMLLFLNSLGEVVPLNERVMTPDVKQDLEPFENQWQLYNRHKTGNPRWGLSLTSLDGGMSGDPDLYSLKDYNLRNGTNYQENDFKTFTPALKASNELSNALNQFKSHGRSHLIRLGKGGHFPPHRDNAFLEPECFRIFAALSPVDHYSFVINERQIFFEQGVLYLLNTTLTHHLVSFVDHSDFLVMNVPLNRENVERVTDLLNEN